MDILHYLSLNWLFRLLLVRLDSRSWDNFVFVLGFSNLNSIWKRLRTKLVGGWVLHDLDLDTQDTLSHQNVSDGNVDELLGWLTRVDHETVGVLLRLGSGSSQLTRNNNLNTLGTGTHGESQDTVSGSSQWQTTQQLGLQGFGLDSGRQTSLLDSLSVDDNTFLGDLESLADQRGQLMDSSTLFTQNTLSVRGLNDNFELGWGLSDFNTGVTLFSQFSGKEFVQFSVEDTVSY